jgi:hypothetical protein
MYFVAITHQHVPRSALCYPVSASIVLLAVVCKEPTNIEAHGDLLLLAWFVEFLERMVRDEGCDLQRMRDGISAFEKVATHAVRVALGASAMPLHLALSPLSLASDQTSKVSILRLQVLQIPSLLTSLI